MGYLLRCAHQTRFFCFLLQQFENFRKKGGVETVSFNNSFFAYVCVCSYTYENVCYAERLLCFPEMKGSVVNLFKSNLQLDKREMYIPEWM